MSVTREQISIDSVVGLVSLIQRKRIFEKPKDIRIALDLPGVSGDRKAEFEDRLSEFASDCGCVAGATTAKIAAALPLVLAPAVFLFLDGAFWAKFLAIGLAMPGFYCVGALAGKSAGVIIAKRRFMAVVQEINV